MAGELVGWKDSLVLLPYGDRFRRYRRFFHKLIGSVNAMKQFYPIEDAEARRFLRRVLDDPNNLSAHIRRYVLTAAVKLHVAFINVLLEQSEQLSYVSLMDMKRKSLKTLSCNSRIRQQSSFPSRRLQAAFS